jgi:hypothetical protein
MVSPFQPLTAVVKETRLISDVWAQWLTGLVAQVNGTAAAVRQGVGTPEGHVTAPIGTLFLRADGGAGTTLYVKETGTGKTGWVGK